MIEFTPQETRFLQHIGRTEVGHELTALLRRMKDYYASIATIDKTRDTNAQVEGREIFTGVMSRLIDEITTKTRKGRQLEPDDFT